MSEDTRVGRFLRFVVAWVIVLGAIAAVLWVWGRVTGNDPVAAPTSAPPSTTATSTPTATASPATTNQTAGAPKPPASAFDATVVWVSDGDTIGATTGGNEPSAVRLIGINTPETKRPGYPVECYGPEASDYLKKLLPKGSRITAAYQDFRIDKFKRELWDIWLPDGTFVQGLLMQGGYARTETWGGTNRDAAYLDTLQNIARRNKVGLWGACPNP